MCDNCKKNNIECNYTLDDEMLQKIVNMTIKEMTDRAYRDIGKKTVNGFYALVGVITVGIYIFLKQKGYIQ